MSSELPNHPDNNKTPPKPIGIDHPDNSKNVPSELTHYRVYLAAYLGKPSHHAIYVEIDTSCDPAREYRWHVQGNIMQGMTFVNESCRNPLKSETGESVRPIGWVLREDFFNRVQHVCRGIPPPKKQYDGPRKRLFPHEPIRKCQEWTAEAIDALRRAEVLERLSSTDEKGTIMAHH